MTHNIRRALITGIYGSGGSYLAECLFEKQPPVEVHGIARWHSTTNEKNLEGLRSRASVHECDLNDFSSVLAVLQKVRPDCIFHLASHANVRVSFLTPLSVMENNVMGTINLFEAVRLADLDPTIVLCSTSEVYGDVDPKYIPITEDAPLRPVNPYAVSKATQDLLGVSYFLSYKMKIIRTRMFSYLNPRRADLFATSFARQIARIECGLQTELVHGNLDSLRTLIDVRDAMEAYWMAALHCQPGEVYNIGGTKSISVGEFLEVLKKLSRVPIKSRIDPSLLRPADVTFQIPSAEKFMQATGWKPKYHFEESVEHLLNHCRNQAAHEMTSATRSVNQAKALK